MPVRQSSQHKKLVKILKDLQKNLKVREEYALKFRGQTYLYDVFVPQFNLVFEVQGEQHLEFKPFFHGGKHNFVKQQRTDMDKCAACAYNNLRLLYIYPNDKLDEEFILNLIEGDRNDAIATSERNPGSDERNCPGSH